MRPWPCLGPSKSTGPVGHWPWGQSLNRPALLGTQGSGLVLARARPWPWPFQIDRPYWSLALGPILKSTGPVGHARVWPCPGPRARGLGLGLGPSKSTGPVGHWPWGQSLNRPALLGTQGSGLVLARARAALALPWPFQIDRPCWSLALGPILKSTGPVGHARVWPCPGPRACGLGPSKSTGPVGHSRVFGLVLARARAALALAFSRFFKVSRIFQCFSWVFNVFQGVSGFVALNSASNSDPPLERESLPPKTPQMRGTPGSARVPIKNAIF